jgi:hypothetical protein
MLPEDLERLDPDRMAALPPFIELLLPASRYTEPPLPTLVFPTAKTVFPLEAADVPEDMVMYPELRLIASPECSVVDPDTAEDLDPTWTAPLDSTLLEVPLRRRTWPPVPSTLERPP